MTLALLDARKLDRVSDASLVQMLRGYDRLVLRYQGDATMAAYVAFWRDARVLVGDYAAARAAARVLPPLADVGGTWVDLGAV